MKIAIIYICTGKYSVFWDEFFHTCQKFFYPAASKSFFLFTDDEKLIRAQSNSEQVFPYFQRTAGWPYDTLLRFNMIATVQDKLKEYDYCYFWNANTVFKREIDETVIPLPTEDAPIVLWRHTTTYEDDRGVTFEVDRDPRSQAYIPPGAYCRDYGGGFFGGTASGFIAMSTILRDRIAKDLTLGHIAVWHDQSHIARYGIETPCVEVPRDTIASEEYSDGKNVAAIFVNKRKYGGNGKLRNLPYRVRAKQGLIRSCVWIGKKTKLIVLYKKVRSYCAGK